MSTSRRKFLKLSALAGGAIGLGAVPNASPAVHGRPVSGASSGVSALSDDGSSSRGKNSAAYGARAAR